MASSASSSSKPGIHLPSLLDVRPRPITPPEGHGINEAAICDALFFACLPFEIRRQILVEAFGDQIIHIDLVYDRPHQQKGAKYHRFRRAPRLDTRQKRDGSALHKLKPKRWLWYSSVCHHGLPNASPWSRACEPCDDKCDAKGPSDCDFWPGERPGKCSLGIMGWLLTCRQAYTEGMDVLWSTNTIRIEDMVILWNARRLFTPHRWSQVTRLEVQCNTGAGSYANPLSSARDDVYALMNHLPSVLGNLKELHISVQKNQQYGFYGGTGDAGMDLAAALLGLFEGMIRKLPPTISDCTVAVPSSLYKLRRDEAVRRGRTVELFRDKQRERHWHPLEGPQTRRSGYWLQLGQTDMKANLVVPCFGTGDSASWLDGVEIAPEDLILYGLLRN